MRSAFHAYNHLKTNKQKKKLIEKFEIENNLFNLKVKNLNNRLS